MNMLKIIWLLTIITAFFGPSLSISGFESVYAFRILLLAQIIGMAIYAYYHREMLPELLRRVLVKEYLVFYVLWFLFFYQSFNNKQDATKITAVPTIIVISLKCIT